MGSVWIELLIIFVLLLANGVFAMAEISVVSSRKARLRERADAGNERAAAALKLAEDPDEFLSTVQIGITLIGIMAGAFGGATISANLEGSLAQIPLLAPYAAPLSVLIVIAGITFASLLIGELVPKRIGLNAPERIAMALAGPMQALSRLTKPIVWFLTIAGDLLLRLLRVRDSNEPAVTQAEIEVMIAQGAQMGVLSEAESEVAQNVFRLADRRVGGLMTRRMEVVWLDVDSDEARITQTISADGHARYPVCAGNFDNVLGIVEAHQLLVARLAGEPLDLRKLARPALFVPETLPGVALFEMCHEYGQHMAIVMDEYGGLQGVITLYDLLEAVVGDVTEATPTETPRAVKREDGSWLLDGMLPVEDFRELFDLSALPGEDDNTFETLGGFVMAHQGRIPAAGDHFEWNDLRFEVIDMDGRRVDKVLVQPATAARAED